MSKVTVRDFRNSSAITLTFPLRLPTAIPAVLEHHETSETLACVVRTAGNIIIDNQAATGLYTASL
jgi:hypothetical protein